MQETQVKIVSLDLVEGQGVLRAVADIEIGELLIRGFRVIQREGQPLNDGIQTGR